MPLFVSAPLAVAGISAVLAAVIAIVDSIVNNYGEVGIDINAGSKELTVNGGAPLLRLLADNDIFLPSACGGRGSCGVCKCKIISDVGPVLPTETPYLNAQEISENIRLACQVKIKADVAIEIPEEIFSVQHCKGVIESITEMTYDIKQVRVRLAEPAEVDFVPGQYAQIVVPPYDKIRDYTQRAYSISSVPSDKGLLEFYIRLVPGGILTTYVFEHMKEKQKVELMAPFGDFHMQKTDAIKLGVAGGSGMAPLKSIILDMYEKGETDTEFWYFFGARAVRDLFYMNELKEMEKKWPNFHFVAALSEPLPEDKWEGDTGLITDVLDRYLKEVISLDRRKEGYLCGSPGMIDACVSVMNDNGVTEEDIHYDKFA